MKTCEETHELCSIMIQRFWPLRYGVLWNGGYSLPRTMRGGCRSVAFFFFSEGAVQGVGGMLPYFFFCSPVLPEMALPILWKTPHLWVLAHIISDCFDAEGGTSRSTTLCCVYAPRFVSRDRFCASISKKVSTAKVHA